VSFWDRLMGRGKKETGDSSMGSEGMQQEQAGTAEDRPPAAEESAPEATEQRSEQENI
jgi:hypothetical protein